MIAALKGLPEDRSGSPGGRLENGQSVAERWGWPVLVWLLMAVWVTPLLANTAPVVSNVHAHQREGTTFVEVAYDVWDADGDTMTVRLYLSEDRGETFPIRCATVTGDVGPGVVGGTGKVILWDAGADYPGHVGGGYVVKVVADDASWRIPMVLVPAGTFMMGDTFDYECEDDHWVTLTHDFWIGEHEVTNGEYMEMLQWAYDQGMVQATVITVIDIESAKELLDLDDDHCEIQFDPQTQRFYLREAEYALEHAYPQGYDPADHPVKEVTWFGAAAFCDWLSLREGLEPAYDHRTWECGPGGNPYMAEGYGLPTDAEWEYAAQYDDERLFPWGDAQPTCELANFGLASGLCVGWTSPVGTLLAGDSQLGIHDLAGNLWEWCNDWWRCGLGGESQVDPWGPRAGPARVIRGCAWNCSCGDCACIRSAARVASEPETSEAACGFRVSRTELKRTVTGQ
jgi:formylglycine-generating enzyme required for sulfatase activity